MSFGRSKAKTSSTQSTSGTSTTSVDPWSRAAYENQTAGILGAAKAYSDSPYQAYDGPLVANLSTDQVRARELANNSVGAWSGILGDATTATKNAMGYDGTDVSSWFNPYEDSVVAATARDYDQGLATNLNQYNDSVAMRGAFGNVSRDLGETDLRSKAVNDKADALARLRYQGYNDARDAGFRSQQAQFQGAGILGQQAGQAQQFTQNDVSMLEQLGATSQQIEQAKLDAAKAQYDAAAADRLQKLMIELNARSGILGALPMGQTTTSSGTGTSSGTSKNSSFQFAPSITFGIGG